MSKRQSSNTGNEETNDTKKFASVMKHLRGKDFKWLKDDMGLYDFPETWDLQVGNDNHK